MPTFASIEFHPAVRSRLVVAPGQSQQPPQQRRHHVNHKKDAAEDGAAAAARPPESPYSLLLNQEWRLRHINDTSMDTAAATSSTTLVAQSEVTQLRQQVARKLIQQTVCGKRQQRIRQDNQNNNKRLRLDGFLSVSEMISWQSTLLATRQQPLCTGVASLDALLSTDAALPRPAASPERACPPLPFRMGLSWGTVLQLSGGPGVGKTQLALRWAVAAATTTTMTDSNTRVHYLVPAHASRISLARRLAELVDGTRGTAGSATAVIGREGALSNILLDTFRDEQELALALAQLEHENHHPRHDRPWILIVDGITTTANGSTRPRTWHRLVRLYHAIVIVVTPTSSSSFGSIHLHMEAPGRVLCQKHPQRGKVNTVIFLTSDTPSSDS